MEIPLPPSATEERRKPALYNMQMLLVIICEDTRQFVNTMGLIDEARGRTPTIKDRVQLTDNGFNLIETYVELFKNHVDTASLNQMQVPNYLGNVI